MKLAAGGHHTCAVLADGTSRCWGSNLFAQLGYDTGIEAYWTVPGQPVGL